MPALSSSRCGLLVCQAEFAGLAHELGAPLTMCLPIRLLATVMLMWTFTAIAQANAETGQGAAVQGTIADSTGRPLPNVTVLLEPGGRRTTSSPTGSFLFPGLRGGQYTLTLRLVGHRQRANGIAVASTGTTRIRMQLERLPQVLDAMRVVDQNTCATTSLDGFECRRRAGIGHFRDAGELRSMRPQYWADMLDGMPGIRRIPRNGRYGHDMRAGVEPSRCLVELWNGQPRLEATDDDGVTFYPDELWLPNDVVAIEYYDEPAKIPTHYKPLAWPVLAPESCRLLIYWMRGAAPALRDTTQNTR